MAQLTTTKVQSPQLDYVSRNDFGHLINWIALVVVHPLGLMVQLTTTKVHAHQLDDMSSNNFGRLIT